MMLYSACRVECKNYNPGSYRGSRPCWRLLSHGDVSLLKVCGVLTNLWRFAPVPLSRARHKRCTNSALGTDRVALLYMFFDARDWQPVSSYRESFQRVGFSVAAFFGAEKVTWWIFRRRKNLPGNFLERWKSYHFMCNVDQNFARWNRLRSRSMPLLPASACSQQRELFTS